MQWFVLIYAIAMFRVVWLKFAIDSRRRQLRNKGLCYGPKSYVQKFSCVCESSQFFYSAA